MAHHSCTSSNKPLVCAHHCPQYLPQVHYISLPHASHAWGRDMTSCPPYRSCVVYIQDRYDYTLYNIVRGYLGTVPTIKGLIKSWCMALIIISHKLDFLLLWDVSGKKGWGLQLLVKQALETVAAKQLDYLKTVCPNLCPNPHLQFACRSPWCIAGLCKSRCTVKINEVASANQYLWVVYVPCTHSMEQCSSRLLGTFQPTAEFNCIVAPSAGCYNNMYLATTSIVALFCAVHNQEH